jgi:hypothetical protein
VEEAIRQGLIQPYARGTIAISQGGGQFLQHPSTRWHIILGCRELQQIDATTPLTDGLKADFSWHWSLTDIGAVSGQLSSERQRGVAYFTNTANGLNIDKIKME